jgi:hypothetical protein
MAVTIYSCTMNKQDKLWFKARNNPGGLKFEEFRQLLTSCGWVQDRQTGSHQIWYSQNWQRISIQDRGGQAKEYQVKQFLVLQAEVYRDE